MATKQYVVNDRIRSKELRIIDENKGQLGILSREEALSLAKEKGLDLVLIAPFEKPPVARITDYGKLKYEQSKKTKKEKHGHKSGVIKELKVRPKIDRHDLEVRINRAKEFFAKGYKVKFTLSFRGREQAHPELGRKVLDTVIEELKEVGAPEAAPRREGRSMFMIITPLKHQRKETKSNAKDENKTGRREKV